MAGMILGDSELRHQALSDVTPLSEVFGLLFFVSVGMLFDPAASSGTQGRLCSLSRSLWRGRLLSAVPALIRARPLRRVGDIASEDILGAAGIAAARMLVVTMPEWYSIRAGIECAKRLNPRLFTVARATGTRHVEDL